MNTAYNKINNEQKILVSISSIIVFGFAITAATFSRDDMISVRRNAATSYSLTLDSINKPLFVEEKEQV